MARPLYNEKQRTALAAMEAACVECDHLYASLEALGVPVDDRRAMNETRKGMCARCREVEDAYVQQQQ